MKNRLSALLLALAFALSPALFAQDQPKPPIDKPPAAPAGDPAKEKEDAAKKWDVAAPPYAYDVNVNLDVDEGTWMSLDVSPTARRSPSTSSATSTRCRSAAARRRR